MSDKSNIQWTEATWNPVAGCTRVSAGCDNCYAVQMSHRLELMGQAKYAGLTVLNNRGDRHFNGTVRCDEDALTIPLKWRKPRRVFVNSMSDLFHKDVPFEFVDRVFAVMALCPQHTFQVLTKRPERMAEYLNEDRRADNAFGWHFSAAQRRVKTVSDDIAESRRRSGIDESNWNNAWPLFNVWLGTSCENQAAADARIPHLLRCPAAVRFLSCEPLLGPLDRLPLAVIHWVIVGGESGPGARPCAVEWNRSIVRQCAAAGVSCFVKQLGSRPYRINNEDDDEFVGVMHWLRLRDRKGGDPSEWPADLRVREMPGTEVRDG